MFKALTIQNRPIDTNHPPFIVAEMSGNHNRSLERALSIVKAAAEAGAHALKLQTYTADTMTLDMRTDDFMINDSDSLWKGRSLHNLYREAHTPWEWHRPIMECCGDLGLICFSTPFDTTAVDFLEELDTQAYKVASFENTDLPLIRKIAGTGKPMLISTGMATMAEVDDTVRAAKEAGCRDLILLKCTSAYPGTPENSNLMTIPHMRDAFGLPVGLSDHTPGIGVSLASVALGAVLIEKHFTLRRSDGGVDSAFSLEPDEMKRLRIESERAWLAMGKIHYGTTDSEKSSVKFRRSLYIAKDLKAGDRLSPDNLRAIRPGNGLPTRYLDILIGKRINRDIPKGSPMSWEFIG